MDSQSGINTKDASSPRINATVSASAGTGKTWMLVTRIIRLLMAGTRPGNILAITFTRKAAAEMQQRLSERLLEFVCNDDETLKNNLKYIDVATDSASCARARSLYENLLLDTSPVNTMTFHSFCQELLQKFPLEADIPPGFDLVEQVFDYQQEALDALYTRASQHPESDTAKALETLFMELGNLFNTRKALMNFLDHRSDWWAFTLNRDNPVEFAQAKLHEQLHLQNGNENVAAGFLQDHNAELREYCKLLAQDGMTKSLKALDIIESFIDLPEVNNDDFSRLIKAFLTDKYTIRILKSTGAQIKRLGEANTERFISLHHQLSQRCLDGLDQLNALRNFRINAAWYCAGHEILKLYQHIKLGQRLLDFTDLEWKTYLLLNHSNNAQWVQYKIDNRIEHLLVDEFQDTNPTQWQFLLPVLQEMSAGESDKPRSVFLVGDEKQSIYRFRRAEPRLFKASAQWLQQHLGAQAFPLDVSRRSADAIMKFVNQVFTNDQRLASFQKHTTVHQDAWGRVEVMPIIQPNDENEEGFEGFRNPLDMPRDENVTDSHYREGLAITDRISGLINGSSTVHGDNTDRPIRYGDIMILVRSRSHIKEYERALRDNNIPYTGIDRGTLLDSLEVRDIIALLSILITPGNNQALVVTLRSPLFSCSDNDLLRLAQVKDQASWYDKLFSLCKGQTAGQALSRACDKLQHWRNLAGHLPVHDLLDRIYTEGNVLSRYEAACPPHLQQQIVANLTRFLELALEIDSGRYPSLSRFLSKLKYAREAKKDSPDEGRRQTDLDCVRLLTIHASKGLEAPVVFVADATSCRDNNYSNKALVHWPPEDTRPQYLMLLPRQTEMDAVTRQCLDRHQSDEDTEDANLLYVALTRARQWLYVSGCADKRGNISGWYADIMRSLPGNELENGVPYVLDSGCLPAGTTDAPQPAVIPDAQLDPRMMQALSISTDNGTVSPSQDQQTGIDTDSGEHDDGQLRGNVIHLLLEMITGNSIDKTSAMQHVSHSLPGLVDKATFDACWEEANAVITEPGLQHLFDAAEFDHAYNEAPIQFLAGNRTINGIIDRLVIKDDLVTIVDYKTHSNVTESNIDNIAADYRRQMELYTEGCRKLWPGKAFCAVLLFTSQRRLYPMN